MKKKWFILVILPLLVSCTSGTSSTEIPSPVRTIIEQNLTPSSVETISEQTETPALTQVKQVFMLPDSISQGTFEDSGNWQATIQSIMGPEYQYSSNDVSPTGVWLLKIETDFANTSEIKIHLYSLVNTSAPIEYNYVQEGTIYFGRLIWAPYGNAFAACGVYNPDSMLGRGGCDYFVIFEIIDHTLRAHTIPLAVYGPLKIVWLSSYSISSGVAFVSSNSGIWIYNLQGSLINHSQLHDLYSFVSVESASAYIAADRHLGLNEDQDLPSNLYKIDPFTLDWKIEYSSTKQISIVGSDSVNQLMVEELPVYGINQTQEEKPFLDIYDLDESKITAQYVIPDGWDIFTSSQSPNYIAFGLRSLENLRSYTENIWIYNWNSRTMEYWGIGHLMGWFPPANSFLVSDEAGDWKFIKP